MNILCVSKYASIPKYGAAARLFYLAKEFAATNNKVSLITSDSNHLCEYPQTESVYNYEKISDVEICWIKTKKYTRTASVSRVVSWFDFEWKLFSFNLKKVNKPDVIIISSLSLLTIFYGYYLKRKLKVPLVFEVRDIWPLTLTEEGGFKSYHPLVLLLSVAERFAYKKSDMVVGTMPNLSEHVNKISKQRKKVFCSPLGFEVSEVSNVQTLSSNPFESVFPSNKKIIGYAGSMGISNALDNYISVIKKFSANEDVFFMLVGSGDLKLKYQKELEDYSNVKFLEKIPQSQVKYFLAKCDLLYLSTHQSKIWEYGQSMNKVVQYMLAGKPIIASYSGYPSMINEAGCGTFVSSNNMEDLYSAINNYSKMESSELAKIGLRGKVWIEQNRNYKTLAQEYLTELDNLVNDYESQS